MTIGCDGSSIHPHLEVDELQVLHQRDQQPAVVELLGQLGHRLGVRLLIVAAVQDLLHGHQTLGHLLRRLEKTGEESLKMMVGEGGRMSST